MMHFHPEDLVLYPIDGSDLWCLAADFHWREWKVPAQFHTDGASIPWLARRWIGSPTRAKYMKAAVLHDWMYLDRSTITAGDIYSDRKVADKNFHTMLLENDVNRFTAFIMFAAVWLVGSFYWKKRSDVSLPG